MSSVAELLKQAQKEVAAATEPLELDEVRIRYLGKKGTITSFLKGLGKLPTSERAEAGKALNAAKVTLISEIKNRQLGLHLKSIAAKLALDKVDEGNQK